MMEKSLGGQRDATELQLLLWQQLIDSACRVRDAQDVTVSFDSYREYIRISKGEFSVCESGYIATICGWFSDRSAAYLASSRPLVV
jgi:hypothetical protein